MSSNQEDERQNIQKRPRNNDGQDSDDESDAELFKDEENVKEEKPSEKE